MPAETLVMVNAACCVIAWVGIQQISRGDRTGWFLAIGAAVCLALPWIGPAVDWLSHTS